MYGLADCNNFFVSCERVFNPGLNGRPVVILSNNDGCVISRSNEAKQLGIKMGQPFYQLGEMIRRHNVAVFSSNFVLYGDMSKRVQQTLRSMVPSTEVYSIDESFLDLRGVDESRLDALGHHISYVVQRNTGIPISVGISPTKTLAKIASKLCKQYPKLRGSCLMRRPEDIEKVLRKFPIEDVWGIGRRFSTMLKTQGIQTAYQFTQLPVERVQRLMHVGGVKTWRELRGEPCVDFEEHSREKQQITVSRSFSKEITDVADLQQQIALFTSMAAEKLRKQQSVCDTLIVFLLTNRHREDKPQQFANRLVPLHSSTDSTLELVDIATRTVVEIARPGFEYKKAGVILSDLHPGNAVQAALFDETDHEKHRRLMAALDDINRKQGAHSVVVATAGFDGIKMNRQHLSRNFTTQWDDIIEINCPT